jgi:[protein-PII] uridylyltransferase
VQDVSGAPFGAQHPRLLARLVESMEAAALGRPPAVDAKKPDLGRAAAFTIAPAVAIDNDAATGATVIEVSGRDRPGLLGAIARTLAEAGLSIQSAHIDNYGERAVDAFYCHGPEGGKFTAARAINTLRSQLAQVLDEEPAEPAEGRPRLERARASVAR